MNIYLTAQSSFNLRRLVRRAAVAALLTSTLAGSPVQAQSGGTSDQSHFYNAQAGVTISGMPGAHSVAFPNTFGVGDFRLAAEPAGISFNNGYGTVFADAQGAIMASQGGVQVRAFAIAQRLTATYTYNSPYAASVMKFGDTLTVTSSTLPARTPVTLVFTTNATASVNGQGSYTANYHAGFSVAGQTSSLNGWKPWNAPGMLTLPKTLTVQTQVGARLPVEWSVSCTATADYFAPGLSGSSLETLAHMKVTAQSQTPGVTVTAASGRNYMP